MATIIILYHTSRGFFMAWLLAITKSFAFLVKNAKAMPERNLCLKGNIILLQEITYIASKKIKDL